MLNEDKNRELDILATMINVTMITSKCTKLSNLSTENLVVHDKAGRNVTEPIVIYNIIRDHFKAHFNDPKESKLEPFIGNPRPLHTTITKIEVAKSIHKLRKNRSPGYDQKPSELLNIAE